jgi:DNA modification methylase
MPERRDESIRIEYLPLSALLKAPRNPKDHDIGLLHDSFGRFGFVEPIAINERTGHLVAGHGRLQALEEAKAAGQQPPKRIEVRDGEWHVPVLRGIAFDNDEEAEAYLVVSNQATAAGGWDEKALAELLREHTGNLRGMGFSEADVADLLLKVANANETQHDEPALGHLADLQTTWSTSPGQLWQIGPHRLACGDATDPAVIEALFEKEQPEMLVTDPPYGVEYNPEWRFKIAARSKDPTSLGKVSNDDRVNWAAAFTYGCVVAYVWHAAVHAVETAQALVDADFELRCQIIWRKQHFAISRGHYHWQHEPCWYAVKTGQTARWGGDRTQTSVWDISAVAGFGRSTKPEDEPTGHSTQKPVECMARPIRNHRFKSVFDPFLGSGTTLVAAHQLGRIGFGCEIDPSYVAAALERMAGLGLKPELLST